MFKIQFDFEPRDMWIGVYFSTKEYRLVWSEQIIHKIYICIIPCFPIIFAWDKIIPLDPQYEEVEI